MKAPSTAELLVKMTREAEQRKLLQLAAECETLDEFRQRLIAMIGNN